MLDRKLVRSGWQSIVETLAVAAIGIGILWQSFGAQAPLAAPSKGAIGARAARSEPAFAAGPAEPISLAGAERAGSPSARLALLMFSDYQCPFCGRFELNTLPELRKRYVDQGRLQLAFVEFPLNVHPFAQKAAEAAECAGRQGRFWEMHDALFMHQRQLDLPSLHSYASDAGLDLKRFDACLGGQVAAAISADTRLGESLQVLGTPTFFLGALQSDGRLRAAKRWSGAQPVSQVEALIDAELVADGLKAK